MTCRDTIEFLAGYVEGTLPLQQRISFTLHLALCRHCRNYLDSYRKTMQASRDAMISPNPDVDPPEELVQAILAARKQVD